MPGASSALHALLAPQAGYRALYLSGGAVAANSLGVPDLGIIGLEDVLIDVRRITDACPLPLLVDMDTGLGPSAFNIQRTVRSLIKTGAAGLQLENQIGAKRCGHRPNKAIVSSEEAVDRIKSAVDARHDSSFFVLARTDSLAVEGLDHAIERAHACVAAGADAIFSKVLTEIEMFRRFRSEMHVPVLC